MTGPREAADWECLDTTNAVTRRDKSPGEPLQLCCGTPGLLVCSPTVTLGICDEYYASSTSRD